MAGSRDDDGGAHEARRVVLCGALPVIFAVVRRDAGATSSDP